MQYVNVNLPAMARAAQRTSPKKTIVDRILNHANHTFKTITSKKKNPGDFFTSFALEHFQLRVCDAFRKGRVLLDILG